VDIFAFSKPYLIDANIDWGQDVWYLKRWLDRHREARPLHMACFTFIDPKHFGIESKPPAEEPQPGWYAISVHRIHSIRQNYLYFLRFRPVAMAGYSIYIYHVTLDEANRVRRELRLPELKQRTEGDVLNVGAEA
jgi:hypothetical protein